ncbi:MAG: hypothetical protein V4733_00575 [Verrucomicrobiota bacterium]
MKFVRNRPFLCAWLALALVITTWFSPWWADGRVLAPLDLLNEAMQPWRGLAGNPQVKNHIVSDAVSQYLVYHKIAADSFRREGKIGWSSLTYGGTDQQANTMALYDDWPMQLHRWFDFWTAWHFGLMGQFLIAGSGMLFFLRGRGISAWWALVGALLWTGNSQFITWIYHRWTLGAFAWVPWVLWAIDHYREGKKWSWPLVPVFLALAIVGGTLQHAVLAGLAIGISWFAAAIRIGKDRPAQCRWFGHHVAWGVIALGLSAYAWLPAAEALLVSNRIGIHTGLHGGGTGIYRYGLWQPFLQFLAYPLHIFPSILGRCDSVDVLKLFKSELFYVAYAGFLPGVIALLAPWRKGGSSLAKWLIVAGLILPLTPLERFLYQRLLLLFLFGAILAFVHFMQFSCAAERRLLAKRLALGMGCVALLWLAASFVLAWKAAAIEPFLHAKITALLTGSSFGWFNDWMGRRATGFIGDLRIWSPQQIIPLLLAGLGIAGLAVSGAANSFSKKRFGHFLVGIAAILELGVFAQRWVVWSDPLKHPLYRETAESKLLQNEIGSSGRATLVLHPTHHLPNTPFVCNTLAAYGIATIEGYDSIVPAGMNLDAMTTKDAAALGWRGVTHAIAPAGGANLSANWNHVAQTPVMTVYENTRAVPRIMAYSDVAAIEQIRSGKHPKGTPIAPLKWLENERSFMAGPATRLLRIAENAAPGWRWRIGNGEWQNVETLADASQGIRFSAPLQSPTLVELRYQSPTRKTGAVISSASFLALLAGFPLSRIIRRQPPTLFPS